MLSELIFKINNIIKNTLRNRGGNAATTNPTMEQSNASTGCGLVQRHSAINGGNEYQHTPVILGWGQHPTTTNWAQAPPNLLSTNVSVVQARPPMNMTNQH